VAIFLASGCGGKSDNDAAVRQEIPFTPEGVLDIWRADSSLVTRLVIELAESDEEQAQGLMYRRSLPERGGMLFVSAEPSMRSFWMRNTLLRRTHPVHGTRPIRTRDPCRHERPLGH
jgi:hypothetical protein